MAKKGICKGQRLKQDQIIGYVGATGLANGAHLHYEILVNRRQVNPMILKLPQGRRLLDPELTQYLAPGTSLEADLGDLRTFRSLSAKMIAETPPAEPLPGG